MILALSERIDTQQNLFFERWGILDITKAALFIASDNLVMEGSTGVRVNIGTDLATHFVAASAQADGQVYFFDNDKPNVKKIDENTYVDKDCCSDGKYRRTGRKDSRGRDIYVKEEPCGEKRYVEKKDCCGNKGLEEKSGC